MSDASIVGPEAHPSTGSTTIGESARRRLVKRRIWGAPATFRITCAPGLEAALRDDVLAAAPVQVDLVAAGAVRATGPFDAVYDLLVRCRLADAVRVRVTECPAATVPMAFDHLTRVPWHAWLPDRVELVVRVTTRQSALRDAATVARTVTAAVRRAGIDATQVRPGDDGADGVSASTTLSSFSHPFTGGSPNGSTGAPSVPRLELRVDLRRDRAEVWLACHRHPLHHRVEGRWVLPGSVRETTAAAACVLGVPADADLVVDPFCGSGTMIEEASSWTSARPPGARRDTPLAPSPALSEARHRHAVRTALAGVDASRRPPATFVASDVDPRAVQTTRHNLERLGPEVAVHLSVDPASRVDLHAWQERSSATKPVLLMHPPYGRRSQVVSEGSRDSAADRVWMNVVARATGWRFVVLHPRAERLAHLEGVSIESVTRFRMRGLANCIAVGTVTLPAQPPEVR